MTQPNEDLVRTALEKNGRGTILRDAITAAWRTLQIQYPDNAWWRRKSSRAAVVWEYSVKNALDAFESDKGVHNLPHYDTVSFIIDQCVLLRLKKANLELRTSNYPTAMASLFHQHEEDLFGYTGLHRVEAAYVLNRFETAVEWIGIVANDENKLLWKFELDDGIAGVIQPLPKPTPKSPTADRIIRPKRSETQKREDKQD